ncbi:MAG: PEP-CTERM sorting domain-containing protein [Phenylobacterium sp.]|uniref:PEPxxWA-CTERM sorting domain-containing protein n=1 Tax=Phenylobacterium sp. TaxID=1871053 RepID=UPI001A3F1A89|nr:PEPxxWA-CTERM sorting domain-containing protein [Phenylobacterium sp.]MBL8770948.1 PEP-CTERM sorting domain-containing protein [Phenylobacterium sp.]
MPSPRLTLIAAALAAGLSSAAQAAIVDLRFEDSAALPGFQFFGPNVYLPGQIDFFDAADNRDYAFHFTYDTAASGPNYGLTLVSGRLGGVTDFSAFTARMTFNPSQQITVSLNRVQTAGSSTYTTAAIFILRDDDGTIGAALPTSLNYANLDLATAAFETRRSGGVGLGYRNVLYGSVDGSFSVPPVVEVGPAVPEPATWAMMILGFGASGAALRRRRGYAASN